jgi:hypothetical protein
MSSSLGWRTWGRAAKAELMVVDVKRKESCGEEEEMLVGKVRPNYVCYQF